MSDSDLKKYLKEQRAKVRTQMEFYFSDSNLAKDRFLKQEIQASKEGYVDLEIFMKFNKIRNLTSNIDLLTKSIKKSEFLVLNEEKTLVRRITEFVEPTQKHVDKKTIYVENLPSKVSNESLKNHFQQKFGKISYISVPKFKTSHQLKGFAFIEFEEKIFAKKAIEFYENKKNIQEIIGKFPKSHKIITDLEKKITKLKDSIKNYDQSESIEETTSLKRKIEDDSEDLMKAKNLKTEGNELNKVENSEKSIKSNKFNDLRVISKKKWLKLREDFLEKQKADILELKTELKNLNDQLQSKINEKYKTKNSNVKTDDIIKGCIIKLSISATSLTDTEYDSIFKLSKQQFKNKYLANQIEHVAYVEIEKNHNKILIRCKSPESAKSLLDNKDILLGFNRCLLDGHEEVEYFEKIYSNRVKKLNKIDKKKDFDLIKECIKPKISSSI